MAKFSTNEELSADIAQLRAEFEGMQVANGTAILDLQETQIEQHDEIVEQGAVLGAAILNLQEEQIDQDGRITALEGA